MRRAHVIGAGLAGLSAALALTDAGRHVLLYESAPNAGGRCRSYFDRELGCRIDNGNHLLLSGNHAAFAYLDRIGERATLGGPGTPYFPFMDLATGTRWTVRPNAGRIPWWIFSPGRRVPGARLAEYLFPLPLRRAAADATVAATLPHGRLYRCLLEPLAVAALNTRPDVASARLLNAVVAETLAAGGAACVPFFPREGLSESLIEPALARLAECGAEFFPGRRIAALTVESGRVTALEAPDGSIALQAGDQVVSAVPAQVASQLLPDVSGPDAFEAILNVHFRIQADAGRAGFIGLIGGTAEWIFVKPGVVSVTISAANHLVDESSDLIAARVWQDVRTALSLSQTMPPWRVVKEKRATFAATPAQEARRPSSRTALSNLALAGDWTATGLPATIEGAIRSGRKAAEILLQC